VRFVAAFMEKGILHVEDERIRFTLPFMEAYLLAKRLTESEAEALQYFVWNSDGFDYSSFTLYAEMGASRKLVDKVLVDLVIHIGEMDPKDAERFILFQNVINPILLSKHSRLHSIQRTLQQAESDVRNGRDQSKQKQHILDASDRVRESAAAKIEEARDQQATIRGEDWAGSQKQALPVWEVALSLLGSGAERLEAGVKRDLVKRVISLAVAIIDRGTRDMSSVDFREFEKELINDPELIAKVSKSESDSDKEEGKRPLRRWRSFLSMP
jgi:hypothetical protein